MSVITSFSPNVCPYFTICRHERCKHNPLRYTDGSNVVTFEMFVNITGTDTRARIYAQRRRMIHAHWLQIGCSTADTQREDVSKMLHKTSNVLCFVWYSLWDAVWRRMTSHLNKSFSERQKVHIWHMWGGLDRMMSVVCLTQTHAQIPENHLHSKSKWRMSSMTHATPKGIAGVEGCSFPGYPRHQAHPQCQHADTKLGTIAFSESLCPGCTVRKSS